MFKFIVILYLISGIILHRAWNKTDRAKSIMKDCSRLATFLITLYSILLSPMVAVKCFIDFIKGGNK